MPAFFVPLPQRGHASWSGGWSQLVSVSLGLVLGCTRLGIGLRAGLGYVDAGGHLRAVLIFPVHGNLGSFLAHCRPELLDRAGMRSGQDRRECRLVKGLRVSS